MRSVTPTSTIVVQQQFDLVGAVLVPIAAILVGAGIAIWVARIERRSIELDSVRSQAAELIRALNAMGRAGLGDDLSAQNASYAKYEQELNAFAAHLGKRDIAVAKFVCLIVARADDRGSVGDEYRRTLLWLATAIELWVRGALKSAEFEDNMPTDRSGSWVSQLDLGQWDVVLRGHPAMGVPDIPR